MTERSVYKIVTETERLLIREFADDDFQGLCCVLQDEEVTYFYGRVFTDQEIMLWLEKQYESYKSNGFGMWAVVLKETGKMVGHAGMSVQVYADGAISEMGYMFEKASWHHGYATEAAIACRDYAFQILGMDTVHAVIRTDNKASRGVARKTGMRITGMVHKNVTGTMMPHYLYSLKRIGMSNE